MVPIVFAMDGDRIVTAVDRKPKRTSALQRLANIDVDPRVSLLADRYDEDWRELWWARADGIARRAATGAERERAIAALIARYRPYATEPPPGPVLIVEVTSWRGWSST